MHHSIKRCFLIFIGIVGMVFSETLIVRCLNTGSAPSPILAWGDGGSRIPKGDARLAVLVRSSSVWRGICGVWVGRVARVSQLATASIANSNSPTPPWICQQERAAELVS